MTEQSKDEAQFPNPDYSVSLHLKEIFNAFTQLLNAILGSCDANQSTSERAYWNRGKFEWKWLYKLINAVAWRETDHCYKAKLKEDSRAINRLTNQGYVVTKTPVTEVTKTPVTDPEVYVTQDDADLQDKVKTITVNAERYEMNQEAMMAEYGKDKRLFIEAAYFVNWPDVVYKYSSETMHRILGSGTNFNFKNRDDLKVSITAAVRAESARRSPDAPARNGMKEDGGQ